MVPRWTGERPRCAVIIDTSSSITPLDLEMGVAAGHFLGRMADVTFYACDTVARNLGSSLPERLPGGGGTDLPVGIDLAIAEGAKCVVLITDCITPWPLTETPVPLIVGANPGSAQVYGSDRRESMRQWFPPEWATVIPLVTDQ